ncbi:hypothetical protein Pan54_01500 [Rubinisphaera italica]|uniref:Uncharacterized protein n=1 Tax=Rubinisphaera italica TaxID=2527969 RepID=A0A5C5X9B9_9PLAN|nr:hypothetical protein Pan54_01500 [Rubinisphaera italica]
MGNFTYRHAAGFYFQQLWEQFIDLATVVSALIGRCTSGHVICELRLMGIQFGLCLLNWTSFSKDIGCEDRLLTLSQRVEMTSG